MIEANRKTVAALVIVTVMLFSSVLFPVSDADTNSGVQVLYDEGNGRTEWLEGNGTTVGSVIKNAIEKSGRTYVYSGGKVSIDGLSERTVGGSDTGGAYDKEGRPELLSPHIGIFSDGTETIGFPWEKAICVRMNRYPLHFIRTE